MLKYLIFILLILSVDCSLQDLKNEIMSGRKLIRGVNLGGWLVIEHWMTKTSPAWRGVLENIANKGEYYAMRHLGHQKGDAQFDEHRRTMYTEKDFQEISSTGLNTVRIPVGYWIVGFDNTWGGGTNDWKVLAPGAIDYLDKAVREWALHSNLLVFLSFHAAKGSQNGMDHSSPVDSGHGYWSSYKENVNHTLDAVEWLVRRYKDEPAFLGIGLLNEPTSQDEAVLKQYYYDAYGRIRNNVKSDCLLSISPLLDQQGPHQSDWSNFMRYPQFYNLRHEWHKYQIWGFEGQSFDQIIGTVIGLRNDFRIWDGNWLFIGEWSMTSAVGNMNQGQLQRYAKEQLETWSKAPGGWTFWSWKFYGDDGGEQNTWSLKQMIKAGFIKNF